MNRSSLHSFGRALLITAGLALLSTPVWADFDLSGTWVSREHEDYIERMPGPDAVEYYGIPLNAEGRAQSLRYIGDLISLPERQCLYYTPHYLVTGPQGFRAWPEGDPVTGQLVAWKISGAVDRSVLTIYMDGRPHPGPNANHPFSGFTTGQWEGNTLTAHMTHIKSGYLRRNGVPSSDQAEITFHFNRHGDLMTVTAIVEDPIYLSEPYTLSRTWQLNPNAAAPATPAPCEAVVELPNTEEGFVPHFLPGKNPGLQETVDRYHIPAEAVLGGPATMYPEFRKTIRDKYVAPEKCTRYCCGWEGGGGSNLGCIMREGLPARRNE